MVVPEFSNLSDYYYPATIESNRGPGTSPSLTLDYKAVNLSDVPSNTELFDFGMDPALSVGLNEFLVVGAELQDLDLEAREDEDQAIGIPHLYFGNAYGILKKATFQKSDIEYLPEMRYASEGNFLYNQLANQYSCNIDMIGNNLFKPGMFVYVNPRALGIGDTFERTPTDRSWSNLMGLGGYHLVTEVAHTISRDGFHTTVKALWQSGGSRS